MINQLHNMDCLDGMKQMIEKGIQADCMVVDPPYKIISGGVTKRKKDNKPSGILNKRSDWNDYARTGKLFKHNEIKFSDWLPLTYRILKEESHLYIMVNDRNLKELLIETEKAGFKLLNILVWKKNNVTPNKWYMKNCEYIVFLRKGKAKIINNIGTKQCLEIDNIRNKLHPTEKPTELLKILIENSTNENDVIFDPFMGSGSTAIASLECNRQFIGFEIDEEYYKKSLERLKIYDEI